MELLSVRDLCKTYPGFTLDHVSFSLESGYIMGFIGRNGAGKTTTLKSMLGLVHPDGGTVEMFGMDLRENESACRQQIGVVLGDARYYGSKRLRDVAETTARFYEHWDDAAYREYMKRFSLDETKRVRELSTGMWVKFTLALALSHGARLLLLDEPTSGLDPVSRDELLDIFRDTVANGERSILFLHAYYIRSREVRRPYHLHPQRKDPHEHRPRHLHRRLPQGDRRQGGADGRRKGERHRSAGAELRL